MRLTRLATAISLIIFITACKDGDDGATGPAGATGTAGSQGQSSLIVQTELPAGSVHCVAGGVRIDTGVDANDDGSLTSNEIESTSFVCAPDPGRNFNRISYYPVCLQLNNTCNTDTETVAEISAASEDGLTVIYTDSPGNQIGFVDITRPAAPQGAGLLAVGGEPTSVAVAGPYALVGVNTSPDFVNPSGQLAVVDINSKTITATIDLGGQPDSVAVSPDRQWTVVAVENERDEDSGNGAPPQLPAGKVVIVNLSGAPGAWTTTDVDMTGTSALYAADPEPEYVDINTDNIAVVTMQENNHLVLIDIPTATIINDFTAGALDLTAVDTTEEDPALISQTESQPGRLREPDGVAWLNNELFATADEGDLDGGSRSFTVFNKQGDIVFSSGNTIDHIAAQLGHYPDGRSGNKGAEPENAEVGIYGNDRYLFINSERSSLIFVYNINDPANPVHMQTLPAGLGPEGALAIPSRNLLVVSSEEDNRGDKFRGGLNIYQLDTKPAEYPTLVSADDPVTGTPVPWGAMSGLAADPGVDGVLYSIEDSFYQQNRIFEIDITTKPATLRSAIRITDTNNVFASMVVTTLTDETVTANNGARADVFDVADLAAMINSDKTVNLDPEGIAVASEGGFWIASEGSGTVGDPSRPVNSHNLIFKVSSTGVIEKVITLPDSVNTRQIRFGLEGVAEQNGELVVAFQRAWTGDTEPMIGIFDLTAESWRFLNYPLDSVASQAGGWVGLSDLTALGGRDFLVVERDNQSGYDAAVKKLYRFSIAGLNDGDTVSKTLVSDLLPVLQAPNGMVVEKVEGAALTVSGEVWIINDNDGVDDNSGETQLINLGKIL
ncbi:MAG: esterase-like activity of phytase family protein [Pseudomonadales bacterium]|nr:esterase-like activity of phytase family protein [Pseudomonadales bacterium]